MRPTENHEREITEAVERIAALSILSDQMAVLAGADQHEAFLSVADLM
jgi:hypothetical protein